MKLSEDPSIILKFPKFIASEKVNSHLLLLNFS
jgi:hypothetical protein